MKSNLSWAFVAALILLNAGSAIASSISGTVTSTATGQPVTRGYVEIYRSTGSFLGLASINNSGNYSYGGLAPGSYFARTDNTGFLDELWNNIPCAQGSCNVTTGTAIVVVASPVTANFSLETGGSIAGSVTVQGSGAPVTRGYVEIYRSTGSFLGLASINNSGNYSYGGLAPGSYFARTDNTGLFDELWNDIPCADGNCSITSGTPISVSSSPVTANFQLIGGGAIGGTVTSTATGQPVTRGYVEIYRSTGNFVGLASINNSGNYSYGGLAAGSYFARTDSTAFFDELWNNIPCAQGVCNVTAGTPIVVGSSSVTANFSLETGGSITGSVTVQGSGAPVTRGYVEIYGSTGSFIGLASINNSGNYSYGGLAAGNYFARTDNTGHLDELYNNIPCAQGACTVTAGTAIGVPVTGAITANFQLGTSDLIFSSGFQ